MYQVDIISSSFNPITNPWLLEYGDEFRFEGREDKVFVVENNYVISYGIISNISNSIYRTTSFNKY
jgi:hypothetical protein